MSQNITLLGASYSDVPSVLLPKTGGGTAQFDDTTIASNAAAASDIAQGKLAYVNGSLVTGTNQGGGGGGLALLATKSLGTISTTSTTATDTGQTITVTGIDDYDALFCIAHTSPHTNGRHIATISFVVFAGQTTAATNDGVTIANAKQNYRASSNGTVSKRVTTSTYGIYINSGTTPQNGSTTLTIYRRYSSNSTGTINGNYVMDVYGVTLRDSI